MSEDKEEVPEQEKGIKTDTISSITLENREEARQHFQLVRNRLLDVCGWQQLAGGMSADFQLIDPAGKPVRRNAAEGDFFRIDLPAPGTNSGEGYDWVRIEKVSECEDEAEDTESVAIRVRPSSGPVEGDETAHFFKSDATSTFIARRKGNEVSAEVHGRNEVPNDEPADLLDTVRNVVVGIGAILGFSKIQWKTLVTALVKKEKS